MGPHFLSLVPASQDGFTKGMRTHNNAPILTTAIDKAKADNMTVTLYVCFIDLKNAFPATHIPTLRLKLYNSGFRGVIFDWLRMLYARMRYVVRTKHGTSEPFKSGAVSSREILALRTSGRETRRVQRVVRRQLGDGQRSQDEMDDVREISRGSCPP